MDFYESIEKYYHHIFPLNNSQVSFVSSFFEEHNKLLEVGSARGSLTNALSEQFHMTGIDLEPNFITSSKAEYPNIDFYELNMTQVYPFFKEAGFNGVVCFGNTIVHLKEENEVESFLTSAYKILKKDGYLLLQLINYDRILDGEISSLPTIDNEYINFKRVYSLDGRHINFETELTVKRENKTIRNVIKLNPLRKQKLVNLLEKVGFKNVVLYGSFEKESFKQTSIPLIISCKK